MINGKRIPVTGGTGSKISFKHLPSDDPKQRQPDIALAKDTLGWPQKIKLDEGLKQTVAYFKQLLHGIR